MLPVHRDEAAELHPPHVRAPGSIELHGALRVCRINCGRRPEVRATRLRAVRGKGGNRWSTLRLRGQRRARLELWSQMGLLGKLCKQDAYNLEEDGLESARLVEFGLIGQPAVLLASGEVLEEFAADPIAIEEFANLGARRGAASKRAHGAARLTGDSRIVSAVGLRARLLVDDKDRSPPSMRLTLLLASLNSQGGVHAPEVPAELLPQMTEFALGQPFAMAEAGVAVAPEMIAICNALALASRALASRRPAAQLPPSLPPPILLLPSTTLPSPPPPCRCRPAARRARFPSRTRHLSRSWWASASARRATLAR
ncbi:hypothetical protein T492DRAFT_847932 [Pavlovales sp. CCMP2436]|nr:hypothetical protein T492DRAFT_847932 [Pavlovales sp. CCMP2436]